MTEEIHEAALNHITALLLLAQDHSRMLGGLRLPPGYLSALIKEAKIIYCLDSLKVTKKILYSRALKYRQLAASSSQTLATKMSAPAADIPASISVSNTVTKVTAPFEIFQPPSITTAVASNHIPSENTDCNNAIMSPTSTDKPCHASGTSIRELLTSSLDALRKGPSDQMLLTGQSLEASLDRVRKFLFEVVQSKGRHGSSSKSIPILYVCGATGCGKSMGVDMCCSDLLQTVNADLQEWESPPQICYLNSSVLQKLTHKQALETTFQRMGVSAKRLHRSKSTEATTRSAFILILDEVDLLISSKGLEGYLRTLLSLASNENTYLSVIGIANSVDNQKARRLNELGFVSFDLPFNLHSYDLSPHHLLYIFV
jgi:Cdc6-like AAA superfamily ATPase